MSNVTSMRREAPSEVEELELELLLEALFQRYGYDFREHQRAPLKRKLRALMRQLTLHTLSALQGQLLHDSGAASAVLRALHVAPAAMFDDVQEAQQLRRLAATCLRGAALPKVWLADCAGAEQAWTLAVILAEEGLLANTEIHCTVPSDELLAGALDASFPAEMLAGYQVAYQHCGGTGQLAAFFQTGDGRATLLPQLRNRISWAQYNLVTDASFNEFNLVVCRRAPPDFGPLLRQRVLRLFHASLAPFGVLGLDRQLDEDDKLAAFYQPLLPLLPWYRRIA